MGTLKQKSEFNAWNPGIESEIPSNLLPLVTLYRPENSTVSFGEAKELAQICGLDEADLVSLRSERLVVHELLIRVTADLSIPDGPNYEDLGINLRTMVATIFEKYVRPEMALVDAAFDQVRKQAIAYIAGQLSNQIFDRASKKHNRKNPSLMARLFGRKTEKTPEKSPEKTQKPGSGELPEIAAIGCWQNQSEVCDDRLEKACLAALVKVVGSIVGHRGRIIADQELITRLTANLVCNTYGSEKIGETIIPLIERAIAGEGYRVLPAQENPVVMNVKGASASGKSTIRPQQRQLAKKIGIPWEDFALISPDYWRKYLIDYDLLGQDYKYGAMLTGQELEIIDKKLDRYMAQKASSNTISHMLIDRFRFDSFALGNDGSGDSKLLSRFGDRIYMFFMVTSPRETVERAWQRGIKTGRYKAVDDLLYHNVEAYTGMLELFLSWVLIADKSVHYEFLDNDVEEGEVPRTSAFGWNNTMTILDARVMVDIERYRKVNIEAKNPDQIFRTSDMSAKNNVECLQRCVAKIAEIIFADQSNGYIYARLIEGELIWCDREYVENQPPQSCVKVALEALGYDDKFDQWVIPDDAQSIDIKYQKNFTLGQWNEN